MKILLPEQIYEADKATMSNLSISSTDLMEKAAGRCFNWLFERYSDTKGKIVVCCGMGNNGGDGLVISRMLYENGFKVQTYLINYGGKRSEDFKINLLRLEHTGASIMDIFRVEELPFFDKEDLVIDAIFGIGLTRPVIDLARNVIRHINESDVQVVSIDLPSGLYVNTPIIDFDAVIKAKVTLTFQVPKLAFLLPDHEAYVGDLHILDIGLDPSYLDKAVSNYYLSDHELVKKFYRSRTKFSHKGTFGHSLIIGGSFGKIGAVELASRAALKSGSGLVSTYIPKCGYTAMQSSNPEVMVEVDDENYLQFFNFKTKPSAIGIGPGLGMHPKTKRGFVKFLNQCSIPLVIDADALNILAEYEELSEMIPKGSVLTPHPKEFERLVGSWANDYEKLDKLINYASDHEVVVVLKGAYTAVAYQGKIWFNSSGNPALATAGSGDVLTGIITSLMAQGYSRIEAAILGVFIHGRTADLAIKSDESMESFTASTCITHLGASFKELSGI